jgi:ADP-heptose:LPS heptosyltransferase
MWGYVRLVYYLLRPRTLFLRCSTYGLGDNLLLSALLPALRERNPSHRIVVETRWPEIFVNNPYPDWVTDRHLKTTDRHLKPKYHIDRDTRVSLYRQLMRGIGVDLECTPKIYLKTKEIAETKRLFPFEYVTICPTGKTTFCANRKEWGLDNFQALRDLMPEVRSLQIGLPSDPLLRDVIDGRSLSVRRTAAAVHGSLLFIGLEGGLMHLARAVDRRAAIIYGGLIRPEISGYAENLNIYQAVECSPCFHSDYPHDVCESMQCMKAISPQMVYDMIKAEFIAGTKRGRR